MRAKISYTIDAEEIPKEVSRLLESAIKMLERLELNGIYITKNNLQDIISKLDNTRKNILVIDERLMECQGILTSYNNVLTSSQTSEEEAIGNEDGLQ